MDEPRKHAPDSSTQAWLLVLCLVGVDYFSTLAYLPSIAAEAAGVWAPIAAGGVVLVTFLLALPLYSYVVGRAPDGRGAAGILEDSMPGWRGKLVVLTLLGFAAADFVITRSLSLADATIHLLHNPHGQSLLRRWPDRVFNHEHEFWPPLEWLVERLGDPQVAITLILSVTSFGMWMMLRRGVTRRVLMVTAVAVICYLALTAVIIVSAAGHIFHHGEAWSAWTSAIFTTSMTVDDLSPASTGATAWAWLRIALWSFPQMALGLSGFEMIMSVVPLVSGGAGDETTAQRKRIRNTRKLMFTAASIMAIYLVSAVGVTTVLVPHGEMLGQGSAAHRALAYVAHGSPLAGGAVISPWFGHAFGDVFDLSSAFILCLAGVSVTLGLQNLLPHYLNRLGMDVHWAGQSGVIMHLLNVIILLVTVVFRASPSLQQWAYATSVLVLLTGAAIAVAVDARRRSAGRLKYFAMLFIAIGGAVFFLAMTGLTVLINVSGLVIALTFVVAIVVSSFISRWLRCTELRFEGFEFADATSERRWNEMRHAGSLVIVPHRPGLISLTEKCAELHRDYRFDAATQLVFVEVELGDPSNFYQQPLVKIERDVGLEVIRLSRCVSVSHVLAALALEFCCGGRRPPEIIFGWSHEQPLAANLNFLLLGEGNVPWMVKELVRKAIPDPARQPRIRIG